MRVHIRTAALFSRPLVEVEVEQENAKTLWILVWRKIAGGGLYRDSIGPSRTGGEGRILNSSFSYQLTSTRGLPEHMDNQGFQTIPQ